MEDPLLDSKITDEDALKRYLKTHNILYSNELCVSDLINEMKQDPTFRKLIFKNVHEPLTCHPGPTVGGIRLYHELIDIPPGPKRGLHKWRKGWRHYTFCGYDCIEFKGFKHPLGCLLGFIFFLIWLMLWMVLLVLVIIAFAAWIKGDFTFV